MCARISRNPAMMTKTRQNQEDSQSAARLPPRQVVTLLYKPNHRLFEMAFEANFDAGPLVQVWVTLKSMGVKILSTTMSSQDGNKGTFSGFLDSENYGLTARAITSKLEALGILRNVKITGGEEVVVNQMFFPLMDPFGNRMMLTTQESFQKMQRALGAVLGSGEGVVAYHEGLSVGSTYAASVRSMLKGDARRFLAELSKIFMAFGIGVCDFREMNFDRLHFVIELRRSIECEGEKSQKPRSQWLRGMLIGAASTILDTPMDCRETKCVAMGHAFCEFEVFKSQGC